MGRVKKPQFEYVESLQRYRKRVKDASGKYVAIYGKTVDELSMKVAAFEQSLEDGITDRSNPLVSEYAKRWLKLKTDNKEIRPGTATDYAYIIRNFISAPLAGCRIADITPSQMLEAVSSAAAKSKSVSTKTVMLAKAIFAAAADDGLISKSPCRNIKASGSDPKKREALTDKQVAVLLDSIKGTRCYPFCMIGLYAGMRREEILALQWDAVHITKPPYYIEVKQALHWEHNRPVVDGKLKTKAAYRNITIPPQLVQCLRELKGRKKSGYVFCGSAGDPLTETQWRNTWHTVICRTVKPRTYYKYIDGKKVQHTITPKLGGKANCRNYCYTIDFEVTPHILRHTYITNLLAAGVDPKTVQYLAGHELSRMTMEVYGHLKYNTPEDLSTITDAAFQQEKTTV